MAKTTDDYLKEISTFFWENEYNPEITQMQELAQFAKLVVDKNKKINLISRNDITNIIENHVFLSSLITYYIPNKCTRFLDIGTGGGFPGIPLAIMRPELRGVLVDSIAKKTDAVSEFVNSLMLSNVEVEKGRVESKEFIETYKKSFDLIVSRATVPLIILMRYAVPLIKEKAFLMAVKGGDLTAEFDKMTMKYGSHIKKSTVFELHYKPSNIKNVKEKKLVLLELVA
jgi:16S rRNA (guanine527-N7)-methyltransferase